MYLKSIELSGFKSFAKKSVLEFNSPISSIVGPNGSGKSNVAEAFRFVLGEQSIKSLRGKKGEDLIFNGGGGEARGNRASVKVIFDNSSKIFSIDFPEVSVERVVHRDGVNDYFINGSQARLKDILELLAGAHIGASGHQIISQGEADKILSATVRERKSIIEDALGLKIYQYKRIESERKLKKTFENIGQVESLRREIAPHLKFLKKQVEKVEKAESMRLELVSTAKEYFIEEEGYINKTKSSIEERRKPAEEKEERLRLEINNAKEILEKTAKEKNKEYVVLELETELREARVVKDQLSRELGQIEGSIRSEERIIKKAEEESASQEYKMIRLKEVEDFALILGRDIDALDESESSLRIFIKSLKDKFLDFIKDQKQGDAVSAVDSEAEISRLKKEKEALEVSIHTAEEREKTLNTKYEDLRKEIDREKDSSRDAEKAVFRIMAEQNENISKLSLLKAETENLSLIESEFKRELTEVAHLVGVEALHYKNAEYTPHLIRSNQEEKKRIIERLKIRLEDIGLGGAEEVMKEFKETHERDEFLGRELMDLEGSAQSLRELIKELEERLASEFSTGLEKINKGFGELFTETFGGGDAHLTLTKEKKKKVEVILEGEEVDESSEEDEIVEEGLDISVNLPRKKIRGLMMLSGGERALTSIALLFAISQVNPPPFIILDETDAALDEANSKKYGDMVEKLSEHSQLILITHNRETMSRAGIIYGVTMSSTGISKLLSIEFDQAVQIAK